VSTPKHTDTTSPNCPNCGNAWLTGESEDHDCHRTLAQHRAGSLSAVDPKKEPAQIITDTWDKANAWVERSRRHDLLHQHYGELLEVEVERLAREASSAPALLAALKAQEEAEQAQADYFKAQGNPPPGYRGPETEDQWSVYLSDLAGDAHDKTKLAKLLRDEALAQVEP
jgi:hypothetical protein